MHQPSSTNEAGNKRTNTTLTGRFPREGRAPTAQSCHLVGGGCISLLAANLTPLSAFATDIVPVRVRQFVDGSQLAYLLVCPRTRAAALIDPLPSMVEHVGSVISEHELKLRFVLRTNPGLKPPANRYRSMLSSLGLSQSEGTPASPSAAVESFDSIAIGNLLQVGPAPARADARAAGEAVLLQAADDTVGVRLFDGNQALEPRFTVGGSLLGGPPPTAHICGSARVALGAFFRRRAADRRRTCGVLHPRPAIYRLGSGSNPARPAHPGRRRCRSPGAHGRQRRHLLHWTRTSEQR